MFRLRPYRQQDAASIITWCDSEEAFYKWSAGILGEYPVAFERMTEATSGRIDNDKYFPFVCLDGDDDDKVVGFFTLRRPDPAKNELRFGFVIVAPQVRGKGVGKKMLQLGVTFAGDIYGADKVTLGVFDNNPSALHCYDAVGFRTNGQTEAYPVMGTEWTCIEMEMPLV